MTSKLLKFNLYSDLQKSERIHENEDFIKDAEIEDYYY